MTIHDDAILAHNLPDDAADARPAANAAPVPARPRIPPRHVRPGAPAVRRRDAGLPAPRRMPAAKPAIEQIIRRLKAREAADRVMARIRASEPVEIDGRLMICATGECAPGELLFAEISLVAGAWATTGTRTVRTDVLRVLVETGLATLPLSA